MAHIILNRPVNKFKIQETIRLIWTALIIKETKLSDVTVVATQFKKKKSTISDSHKFDRLCEFMW